MVDQSLWVSIGLFLPLGGKNKNPMQLIQKKIYEKNVPKLQISRENFQKSQYLDNGF